MVLAVTDWNFVKEFLERDFVNETQQEKVLYTSNH